MKKDSIQKYLTDQKKEVLKLEGVIGKLTEMVKNEWTPCPMYIVADVIKRFFIHQEEEKEEKINEEIPENVVEIHFKKSTYEKAKVYFDFQISKTII